MNAVNLSSPPPGGDIDEGALGPTQAQIPSPPGSPSIYVGFTGTVTLLALPIFQVWFFSLLASCIECKAMRIDHGLDELLGFQRNERPQQWPVFL